MQFSKTCVSLVVLALLLHAQSALAFGSPPVARSAYASATRSGDATHGPTDAVRRQVRLPGDPVRRSMRNPLLRPGLRPLLRPGSRSPIRRITTRRTPATNQGAPSETSRALIGFRRYETNQAEASRIIVPDAPPPVADTRRPIGFDYPGRTTFVSRAFDLDQSPRPATRIGFRRASQREEIVTSNHAPSTLILPSSLAAERAAERAAVRPVGFNRGAAATRTPGVSRGTIGYRRNDAARAPSVSRRPIGFRRDGEQRVRTAPQPRTRIGFRRADER